MAEEEPAGTSRKRQDPVETMLAALQQGTGAQQHQQQGAGGAAAAAVTEGTSSDSSAHEPLPKQPRQESDLEETLRKMRSQADDVLRQQQTDRATTQAIFDAQAVSITSLQEGQKELNKNIQDLGTNMDKLFQMMKEMNSKLAAPAQVPPLQGPPKESEQ